MDVMDHLAADLSCALEETKNKKGRHWKHRRSRSTSNLLGTGAATKTDSENSSSDENKSDNAERSFAKLTLQNKSAKYIKQKIPMQSVVESDSFNELFGGSSQPTTSQMKRRRRHKRMAVDTSELNDKYHGEASGLSSVTAVIPKLNDASHTKIKKKVSASDAQVSVDFGKRKRGHRDRLAENCSVEGNFTTIENVSGVEVPFDDMDEDMKSDSGDTSSVFSSSESDSIEITCDEGQEGDDEHSDWVGDDWMVDDGGDSAERRRDLIMRRLRDNVPSREIRAGKRRIHPNKPVFSFRTSANEQLSKFLQDPEQSELKLHPMRKSERIQLSHIASLYSLQMRYHLEGDGSEKGFTCPILTKTSNTAQMDAKSADEDYTKASWLGSLWIESDSKRVKK